VKPQGEFVLDEPRVARLGMSEAIYCAGKSPAQITAILDHAAGKGTSLLLTRLAESEFLQLPAVHRLKMDFDPISRTGFAGVSPAACGAPRVAVVTAGTSDVPVAREAVRTLHFEGFAVDEIVDVGVAGLWRLLSRVDRLRASEVVIVVAGMDAALPSVVGGLVPGLVIAVPTSVGYGVAQGGHTALHAALASCAPGIVVVNIDNGYGAACAAIRALGSRERAGLLQA
jgi:NCAIR mutase (PurE)-related protein